MTPCDLPFPRLSSQHYPKTLIRPYAFNESLSEYKFLPFLCNALWSVYQINFQPIFTPPYPFLALVSIPIPSSHLVPPPRFHFFQSHTNITYVIAHHRRKLYSFHMMFECRHNIRNQPVSMTMPCPSSFCDITTIMK